MANKVWVFDLDDTLMKTADTYVKIIEKACRYMLRHLKIGSVTLSQLKQKRLEIDSDLRKKINPVTGEAYHYSRERFPLSFVETYKYFCKQQGTESEHMVERKLYDIGSNVCLTVEQYMRKIKEEVWVLLPFLKEKGDILLLLTKGDRGVQKRKLKALTRLGLMKYFSRIKGIDMIVPDKNQRIFKERKKMFPGRIFFSVGNEFNSDILPAIKEGFFGIYIPASNASPWDKGKLKEIEKNRDKKRTRKFSNLLKIKERYEYL